MKKQRMHEIINQSNKNNAKAVTYQNQNQINTLLLSTVRLY